MPLPPGGRRPSGLAEAAARVLQLLLVVAAALLPVALGPAAHASGAGVVAAPQAFAEQDGASRPSPPPHRWTADPFAGTPVWTCRADRLERGSGCGGADAALRMTSAAALQSARQRAGRPLAAATPGGPTTAPGRAPPAVAGV